MTSFPIEYDIILNPCLGATLLSKFAIKYFSTTEQIAGPGLVKSMLVLPMVLHLPTREKIYRMNFDSALEKSIQEQPLIIAGLQSRLECHCDLFFQSLRFGTASGLLELDKADSDCQIIPKRRSLPRDLSSDDNEIKMHLKAAERLGAWFSRSDDDVVCKVLKIRF